jgi:hypothetical protein
LGLFPQASFLLGSHSSGRKAILVRELSMARYHLNPQTGDPGICRAKKNCPFGDMKSEHYDSKRSARAAYESQMAFKEEKRVQRANSRKLNWNSLTADQKLTVHAGIMRTKYFVGDRERKYWDAVFANTDNAKAISPIFFWLFEDGYNGGFNHECHTPTSHYCWGHRRAILAENNNLSFGAAWKGDNSAMDIVSNNPYSPHQIVMSWKSEERYLSH